MTLPRGFGQGMKEGTRRNFGVRTFWLPPSTDQRTSETTVVLLDDTPVCLYRHQLFIKGDKDAAQMRQTCADPQSQDDVPRTCLVCEGMIRHKNIGRKLFVYLTVIDERAYRGNDGRDYKDQKLLLELDKKGGEIFMKRKEAHGSLTGMRFRVYRSSAQNSARYGDSWEKLGNENVDLITHFWYSPAIPRIMESSSRGGSRPLDHGQAVAQLVTPYNYDEIMESYKPAEAERFVIYLTGGMGAQPAAQGHGGGQGGYAPPPPPPGRGTPASPPPQGGYAPQAPNYAPAVPAGQVPTHAQQPQPGYAPPPQQGYPPQGAPPPRTPDPAGASQPQGAYQAPPAPPPRAPMGHPAPQGYQQPPAPAPQPQGYPQPQGGPQYAPQPQAPPQGYPPQGGYPGAPPQAQPGPQPAYMPPPPPQPGQHAPPQGAPPGPGYAPPPPPRQPGAGLPPQAAGYDFERGGPGWSQQPPGLAPPPQGGPPPGPGPSGPPPEGEPDLPF